MYDRSAETSFSSTRTLRVGMYALLGAFSIIGCAGDETGLPAGAGATGNTGPVGGGSAVGTSGAGGTPGAPASGGADAGGSTSTGGLPSTIPPSAEACPSQKVSRTPLRRLTRFEYANTVRHLLNVDSGIASTIPIDEVTDGFNNNAAVLTVSALHAEKYVLAAESLAKEAVKNLATLAPCEASAQAEEACALQFARSFGRRAFRRALVPEDEQLLMAAYAAGSTGGSYAEGIEVMIRAALQSSHFLYRLETTTPSNGAEQLVPLSQFEIGTRLSFLLWAAGPDDALLDAAARGELATREQVAAKARAMLNDPKARPAISEFYNQWLGTSRLDVTSKNATYFPTYSDALRDAMAQELPAFVEHVLWAGDHKLDTLFTSQAAFVSGPLAQLYGVTPPGAPSTTPQMVTLPAEQGRSGILTQAGFLAVQAHPDQTSPVLRGKFVRTKILCQPPPPPPPDADISPPDIDQGGTARERFSAHLTAGNSCSNCHALMDPVGLAFENFDAVGRYRQMDDGRVIDVSGEVIGAHDASLAGAFIGVRELATKLAGSDQVRNCVATQWFRYAAGRSEAEEDICSLATLQEQFTASGGDLIELLVGMTQTDAFWYRSPATQEVAP